MDYEKKYKRALDNASVMYKCGNSDVKQIMEQLFPELVESKDEKNIKNLIDELKCSLRAANCQNDACGGRHEKRIALLEWGIAWLEKQGEQKFSDIDNKFIRMRETKPKDISEFLDRLTTVEQEFLWDHIEKIRKLDKEEQKPADKVEPKFKVGDWIASNYNNVAYVESISETKYNLQCNDGYHEKISIEYIDSCWHLWTIQDAKDSDVLSDGTTIFIFKDLLSDNSVMSYCDYDTDSGESDAFCPLSVNLICSKIIPATKEQQDLLFSKMKEAGYEWDAEKKELKKIEQKPITPKFRVGDKVHLIKGTSPIYEDDCLTIGEISNSTYYGDTKDGWFNIEDQDRYELVEQKPVDINPNEFNLRLSELLKQFETLPKEELVDGLSFYLNVVENDGKYVEEQNFKNQEPVSKFDSCIQNGDKVIYNEELGCRVNLSQLKSIEKNKNYEHSRKHQQSTSDCHRTWLSR